MSLGVQFDNCGSLCVPVLGLLIYQVIAVELIQEGLGINLVFDEQNSDLEVLS